LVMFKTYRESVRGTERQTEETGKAEREREGGSVRQTEKEGDR